VAESCTTGGAPLALELIECVDHVAQEMESIGNLNRVRCAQAHAISECGATVRIVYGPVAAEEARRRLLANGLTRVRNDVRDEDFDLVVTRFEPPDDESDVVRHDFHPEP
jgi:hypothetical protein